MITMMRAALLVGSLFVHKGLSQSLTTTTIPWVGSSTTSTTLSPCTGPATVVIQTPLPTPTCPSPVRPTPCGVLPGCKADGLNIDYYYNPVGGYSSGDVPSSYYITEGLTPLDSSLTNITFFPQDTGPVDPGAWTRETNGGIIVNANNFTLVYYGFYRAPATGVFNICSSADNENDIFFGRGNAFSCDSGEPSPNQEPLVISRGGNFVNPDVCMDVYLVEGAYYPVRNVMGNWLGPSAFNFIIRPPNSQQPTNDFSGNVYPVSCRWFF